MLVEIDDKWAAEPKAYIKWECQDACPDRRLHNQQATPLGQQKREGQADQTEHKMLKGAGGAKENYQTKTKPVPNLRAEAKCFGKFPPNKRVALGCLDFSKQPCIEHLVRYQPYKITCIKQLCKTQIANWFSVTRKLTS